MVLRVAELLLVTVVLVLLAAGRGEEPLSRFTPTHTSLQLTCGLFCREPEADPVRRPEMEVREGACVGGAGSDGR